VFVIFGKTDWIVSEIVAVVVVVVVVTDSTLLNKFYNTYLLYFYNQLFI